MIKPKPDVGSTVVFAMKIKSSWGEVIELIYGEVISIIKPSSIYLIKWVDEHDWQNPVEKSISISIKDIYSFKWGGILTVNPQRNKNLFQSIGLY